MATTAGLQDDIAPAAPQGARFKQASTGSQRRSNKAVDSSGAAKSAAVERAPLVQSARLHSILYQSAGELYAVIPAQAANCSGKINVATISKLQKNG